MLAWDDLRHLLAVHRTGSLAKAAKALGVDKSTVSRRVAALEDALGVRLLERLARGPGLTERARDVVAAAERIESEVLALESALARADETEQGEVRLTAPIWFTQHVLIPSLPRFREAHPGVDLRIVTTNALINMAQREADVALRNVRPTENSLVVRKVGLLGSALYGARAYFERMGTPGTREALAAHYFLAYDDAVTYSRDLSWLTDVVKSVAFRATDTMALLDATRAGIGLAVLPCFIGDGAPDLARLGAFGVARDEIWLVTQRDIQAAPRVRVTMDFIAGLFREHKNALGG